MNYSTVKFRIFPGRITCRFPVQCKKQKATCGFTVIELLTVLAVFAITLNFVFPSFKTMLANNRISSQIESFNGAISLARSEAIKLGAKVLIIPINSNNWSKGWDIVIPGNKYEIVSHVDAFYGDTVMVADLPIAKIQFTDQGRIKTLKNIVFTLCNSTSTPQQEIIGKTLTVSPTGITYLDSRYSCP